MKNRPLPVIIVAILFILAGSVGFVYHINELFEVNGNVSEAIWILILRILAVICGVLLLYRINWARWLAIAWMAYHVAISALNSTSEMITHIVFLILVAVLLFLPVSSAFFKNKTNNKEEGRETLKL